MPATWHPDTSDREWVDEGARNETRLEQYSFKCCVIYIVWIGFSLLLRTETILSKWSGWLFKIGENHQKRGISSLRGQSQFYFAKCSEETSILKILKSMGNFGHQGQDHAGATEAKTSVASLYNIQVNLAIPTKNLLFPGLKHGLSAKSWRTFLRVG